MNTLGGAVQANPFSGASGLDIGLLLKFSMSCKHDIEVVSQLLAAANIAFMTVLNEQRENETLNNHSSDTGEAGKDG